MQMIPHLGHDKQVLALTRRVLVQELANRLADFVLVAVEPGTFEMAIADFSGVEYGFVGLTFGAFVGEGSEADSWDGYAVGGLEGYS